jgi:hypothetical protein
MAYGRCGQVLFNSVARRRQRVAARSSLDVNRLAGQREQVEGVAAPDYADIRISPTHPKKIRSVESSIVSAFVTAKARLSLLQKHLRQI